MPGAFRPCASAVNGERTNSPSARDMVRTAAEMLEAAGAKDITLQDVPSAPGVGIHEMGSARMGHDPKTSVLNAHNQAHDVQNLFHYRRFLHGVVCLPEPVIDLHGAHCPRL